MAHTSMIVASLLGHFSTPLLSNSITTSFRSVLGLGNWNLSACLSGNLVAHLSWDLSFYLILDGVALLFRLVLGNRFVLSGTLLSIFSIARLPGHLHLGTCLHSCLGTFFQSCFGTCLHSCLGLFWHSCLGSSQHFSLGSSQHFS